MIEVNHWRASYSMVQAVKSVCPVYCCFWVIAVYKNNIPAREKKFFRNYRKCIVFSVLIHLVYFVYCIYILHLFGTF